jgi:hypothetical protein
VASLSIGTIATNARINGINRINKRDSSVQSVSPTAAMALSSMGSRRENIAAVRALYNQCECYDDLLTLAARTRDLLAAQLANRIRNWRANHHLDSLAEAFAEHKRYTFLDAHKHRVKRARKRPPDVPPASAQSSSLPAPQPPDGASSVADVTPPPAAVAPSPPPAAPPSALSDAVLVELQAQVDALKKEVSALRGLQQQTNTPSPLQYKPIAAKFRKHCRELSIVGDGGCLMYTLSRGGTCYAAFVVEGGRLAPTTPHASDHDVYR